MRRTVLALSIVAAVTASSGVAAAQPAGWIAHPEHARVVERDLVLGFPEGARANVRVESFRSPEPGGQLITWTVEIATEGDGGAFVRHRIEDLRTTVDAVASGGGAVRTVHWSERPDPKEKWVEARLEWADDDSGVLSIVRSVWVRPAGMPGIREHRAECVLAADAAAALRPACEQALARLAVTPAAERDAIDAPAAEAAPGEVEAEREPADSATMRETPPHVGPVLATREAPREERDLRPFYVGGFLLVVIAVLWWNRKRNAEVLARAEEKAAEPAEPLADEEKEDQP